MNNPIDVKQFMVDANKDYYMGMAAEKIVELENKLLSKEIKYQNLLTKYNNLKEENKKLTAH